MKSADFKLEIIGVRPREPGKKHLYAAILRVTEFDAEKRTIDAPRVIKTKSSYSLLELGAEIAHAIGAWQYDNSEFGKEQNAKLKERGLR